MSIYEEIKRLRLEARKQRDTPVVEAYTYIQGELERGGEKFPSDEKTLKALKKIETAFTESGDTVGQTIISSLLEKYTPKQLSEEAIVTLLRSNSFGNVGEAQKYLKANYPGQYDGAVVTRLFKEMQ